VIYFAQSPDGGTVKIGCSDNVPTRIKQLETHYGRPLALLATMPGGRDQERAIHERFDRHRLRKTEQFRPAAEIMAFIGRPLLVGPDPDAVEVMDEADRPGRRRTAILVGMSHKYKGWLEEAAAHCQLNVASLVAVAVAQYVKAQGFEKKPPRRVS
jgi:hypothetical protein